MSAAKDLCCPGILVALDLDCFPGEHGEQQLQLQAFQEAWGAINSTIKVSLSPCYKRGAWSHVIVDARA